MSKQVSIRASLQQRGEHVLPAAGQATFKVSIRASLQQRGERIVRQLHGKVISKFQSAPHFSSEANLFYMVRHLVAQSFNPRLTSAARRTRESQEV